MLNIKIASWSLGIFTAISYVLCVIYGLVAPSMNMPEGLEMALPGFKWLTLGGLLRGADREFSLRRLRRVSLCLDPQLSRQSMGSYSSA